MLCVLIDAVDDIHPEIGKLLVVKLIHFIDIKYNIWYYSYMPYTRSDTLYINNH